MSITCLSNLGRIPIPSRGSVAIGITSLQLASFPVVRGWWVGKFKRDKVPRKPSQGSDRPRTVVPLFAEGGPESLVAGTTAGHLKGRSSISSLHVRLIQGCLGSDECVKTPGPRIRNCGVGEMNYGLLAHPHRSRLQPSWRMRRCFSSALWRARGCFVNWGRYRFSLKPAEKILKLRDRSCK